jgi:Tfp pilus assembly PilM family ATPase
MFEQTVTGLDVGSFSAKFTEIRAGLRGIEFVRFEELILPEGGASEEIEATIQLFAQQRSLDVDFLVSALDTRSLTQRHFRLPFTGSKRVGPALRFEIDEQLPLGLDALVTTHDLVEVRAGQTDALVLVATRDEMARYLASMKRMELDPQIVDAEGAVLANLSRYFALDDVPRALLDVGHRKSNLCLLVGGHAIALRRIPIGGHHLTEALARDRGWSHAQAQDHKHSAGVFERGSTKPLGPGVRDALDRLARETLRSIQSIVSDPTDVVAPAQLLLMGGSARLAGLAAYLAEKTAIECRTLEAPARAEGSERLADIALPTYAQSIALALRGSRTERVTRTDFRTGSFAHGPGLARMRGQLQLTLALLGALLVLWTGASAVKTWVLERDVHLREEALLSIHSQLFPGEEDPRDALASIEARAREMRELAGHLGITGASSSALTVLREISARAPAELDVSLDELRIGGRSITARGRINDIASLDRFRAELQKFEGFESVELGNVTTDPRNPEQKSFTLEIRPRDVP